MPNTLLSYKLCLVQSFVLLILQTLIIVIRWMASKKPVSPNKYLTDSLILQQRHKEIYNTSYKIYGYDHISDGMSLELSSWLSKNSNDKIYYHELQTIFQENLIPNMHLSYRQFPYAVGL